MTTKKITADAETMSVEEARAMEGLTPRKNLVQKICEVITELGPLAPAGTNTFHKYKYFSDEQISNMFRDAFAKRNVLLVPEVTSWDIRDFETEKGKHSFLTTMMVRWMFHDGDSGDLIEAVTLGQGDDPGDKGANKAMTGAFKYLLIKMAMIGGESDAEADERTDKRHAGPQRAETTRQNQPARVEQPQERVEGVQKGGRQAGASEPQVDVVSRLAAELNIGMDGLVNVVKNVLGVDIEMPEAVEDKKKMLRAFFEGLTSEEIGKVVQALDEAKQRQPA